ncbi:jg26293 [Pararge aegeria aegeria]|uniref:Jg26293 protein n=1 Tax=Pararge aegeria aegeria TaxID=348720 RepID=A0A8S4R019_9NEOP|nr:jg26293 [Pararge aegeria aegeria]
MTYGSETWLLTMGLIRRLRVTQRAMERVMLRNLIRNEEIRRKTRVTDIAHVTRTCWRASEWGSARKSLNPRARRNEWIVGLRAPCMPESSP